MWTSTAVLDIVPHHAPNFDKGTSIDAFKDIRASGFNVEHPVLLIEIGNGYLVEGGHHRLATVGLMGYKRVPAMVVSDLSKLYEHQIKTIAHWQFNYASHRRLIPPEAYPPFFEHAEQLLLEKRILP